MIAGAERAVVCVRRSEVVLRYRIRCAPQLGDQDTGGEIRRVVDRIHGGIEQIVADHEHARVLVRLRLMALPQLVHRVAGGHGVHGTDPAVHVRLDKEIAPVS